MSPRCSFPFYDLDVIPRAIVYVCIAPRVFKLRRGLLNMCDCDL